MSLVALHGITGPCWGDGLGEAFDWPMPGFRGTPPLPETSFPALAAALRAALDARGIGRATLLGHSMGGMLAQEFAATWPERVTGLVLYATSPAFGGRDPGFAEAFRAARLGPLADGRGMAAAAPALLAGMFAADVDPATIRLAESALAEVPEAVYRTTVQCLTTFDRRNDLARIAVPTLVIAGEHDQAAPPRMMQRMAAAIPGARFVTIAGAAHFAHLEKPAAFRAALDGFTGS